MIEFNNIKVIPSVRDKIDRGAKFVKTIIKPSSGHTVEALLDCVRQLPEIDPDTISSTENYVFATLTPGQVDELARHEEVAKIWPDGDVTAMMAGATPSAGAINADSGLGALGAGIVWAVLDDGIDSTHEALQGTVILQRNFCVREPTSPPLLGHGTHMAGIIAGSCDAKPFYGIAPKCKLVDFTIMDPTHTESSITIQALEQIRKLNQKKGELFIHGVNLSVGYQSNSDFKEFSPGHSPICEEVDRLVESGVVVCAAAGNYGARAYETPGKSGDPEIISAYVEMGIVDPGNARSAITVGSTHKDEPEKYGVSGFSSKGPTGDGRFKPDLVAPGEKVLSCFPGNAYLEASGTSQATAWVTGTAVLLMSTYPELVGKPLLVKEILMSSCRDLGRSRNFQGAGFINAKAALETAARRFKH